MILVEKSIQTKLYAKFTKHSSKELQIVLVLFEDPDIIICWLKIIIYITLYWIDFEIHIDFFNYRPLIT